MVQAVLLSGVLTDLEAKPIKVGIVAKAPNALFAKLYDKIGKGSGLAPLRSPTLRRGLVFPLSKKGTNLLVRAKALKAAGEELLKAGNPKGAVTVLRKAERLLFEAGMKGLQSLWYAPLLTSLFKALDKIKKSDEASRVLARLHVRLQGKASSEEPMVSRGFARLSSLGESTIEIKGDPKGASVAVDGRIVGKLPQFSAKFPPGTHLLNIEHPGFLAFKEKVEATKAGKVSLRVYLRAKGVVAELSHLKQQALDATPASSPGLLAKLASEVGAQLLLVARACPPTGGFCLRAFDARNKVFIPGELKAAPSKELDAGAFFKALSTRLASGKVGPAKAIAKGKVKPKKRKRRKRSGAVKWWKKWWVWTIFLGVGALSAGLSCLPQP